VRRRATFVCLRCAQLNAAGLRRLRRHWLRQLCPHSDPFDLSLLSSGRSGNAAHTHMGCSRRYAHTSTFLRPDPCPVYPSVLCCAVLCCAVLCCAPGANACRHIAPLPTADDGQTLLNDPSAASRAELKELVDSLGDTQPAGALVSEGKRGLRGRRGCGRGAQVLRAAGICTEG
jgi:hypothetical protein